MIPYLEGRVKHAAERHGFTLVGITTPQKPHTFDTYNRWIGAGRHAGMGYLATERALKRRQDPRRILPDCQSIIVTGTPYLPADRSNATGSMDARVASYALGEDYHEVIVSRLERLVQSIEDLVGKTIPNKIYTDTGPILERDLAQRAGIGWIGKNTCLISPSHGSYFLLGEILLGIPLQPDAPFESDRCGTCTRCLEACPTKCILPDRTIDANRCISYLTIEEKGSIENSLRSVVENWLFGCDLCQQVCPWNVRFSKTTHDPAFQPRPLLQKPELSHFLQLKPEIWLQGLRGSPLERPRRRGLVRNAAVLAGNSGQAKYQDELILLLSSDPEPIVRSHAAWAIGRMMHPRCERALREAIDVEQDASVQAEIRDALDAHSIDDY